MTPTRRSLRTAPPGLTRRAVLTAPAALVAANATAATLQTLSIADFEKVAIGVDRGEHVVVSRDGRVYVSDRQCAVAEVTATGLRRLGPKGGAPNGLAMDAEGRILIANFGVFNGEPGGLQRFDPATGAHETLVAEIEGRPLSAANFPVIDPAGNIWCSHSTYAPTWPEAMDGRPDGFIFVRRPDGKVAVVARGLRFANGLALSADAKTLYCAQTSAADVLAFDVLPGARLSKARRYGPVLGRVRRPGQPAVPAGELGATDGVGLDVAGNLWVTLPGANKIVAITPTGQVITMLHDPTGSLLNGPTNVTWGGVDRRDLYIGSNRAGFILKGRSPLAGQALLHQVPL